MAPTPPEARASSRPSGATTSTKITSGLPRAALFGSPRDVTLDEVAVETFFPADTATAHALRAMAGG